LVGSTLLSIPTTKKKRTWFIHVFPTKHARCEKGGVDALFGTLPAPEEERRKRGVLSGKIGAVCIRMVTGSLWPTGLGKEKRKKKKGRPGEYRRKFADLTRNRKKKTPIPPRPHLQAEGKKEKK